MSYVPPVEDCRDYLRTGRCKYGMSCKYNHPPNVQNGGGIKPSDPSGLLFPLRPNEPVCDYYMKHRTCKFGSACKFNHPLHMAAGTYSNIPSSSSNNTTSSRRSEPVQLLLSPVGTEATANGQVMMMQYLPQRPGEPDCIYFLKNRSCKYGATCRYHHPVVPRRADPPRQHTNKQQQRHEGYGSNNNNNNNPMGNRVQYVIPSYNSQGQQVMLSGCDTQAPITVITVDGNNGPPPPQGFLVPGDAYCRPAPPGSVGFTEQSSSASSVGSSLETNGELDHSRIRRNMSVGSFNSEARVSSYLPHSTSDGSIARRTRASSFGDQLPSSSNSVTWSQRARGASFAGGRQEQGQPYHYGSNHVPRRGAPSAVRHRSNLSNGTPDEGFTRMTSALLSMLDTQEEAASESGEEDSPGKGGRTPRNHDDASEMLARLHLTPNEERLDVPQEIISTEISYDDDRNLSALQNEAFLRSLSGGREPTTNLRSADASSSSWSPQWSGARSHQDGGDGDFLSAFHTIRPAAPRSDQPQNGHGSDVGMYLP